MKALAVSAALVSGLASVWLASAFTARGAGTDSGMPDAPHAHVTSIQPAASTATKVGSVIVLPEPAPAGAAALDLHLPGIDEEAGNRLLGALVAEGRPGLARELERIARDIRHTPRWRNYAVQHLADLHARDGELVSGAALRWAAGAEEALVREAGVFGLARVTADHGDPAGDVRGVIDRALESDPSDLVREAAIRGLVLLGWRERNPALLRLAGATEGAPALRVAAVDALGVLGGAEELRELERVRAELQPRRDGEVLARALERACARLAGGRAERVF